MTIRAEVRTPMTVDECAQAANMLGITVSDLAAEVNATRTTWSATRRVADP